MSDTLNYSREVPVVHECDVLVVGGGPAGIGAGIAAARAGARTALVERYGFLGGNATAGLVGPFMTSFSGDGEEQLIRGAFDELVRRMAAMGGAIHPSVVRKGSSYSGFIVAGHDHVTPFDPEAVKVVAAEMMQEAGVRLFLHSFFVDPIMDGGRIAGVIVANKSGLQALKARTVVDCSADADVAFRAGVPMRQGRASDGLTQPMTMFFRIANVDNERVHAYVAAHLEDRRPFAGIVKATRERGEFPIPREGIGMYETPQKGVWRINTTRLQRLDGTRVEDLTRAEIEGRNQVMFLMDFFHKHCPGLENVVLLDTATQIGVRETRRIEGEYTLTEEDLVQGTEFPDVIALCSYPIDIQCHGHRRRSAGGHDRPRLSDSLPLPGAAKSRAAAGGGPLPVGDARGPGRGARHAAQFCHGPGGRRGASAERRVRSDSANTGG